MPSARMTFSIQQPPPRGSSNGSPIPEISLNLNDQRNDTNSSRVNHVRVRFATVSWNARR